MRESRLAQQFVQPADLAGMLGALLAVADEDLVAHCPPWLVVPGAAIAANYVKWGGLCKPMSTISGAAASQLLQTGRMPRPAWWYADYLSG